MYLQFDSVKELSKNHHIWVQVLFGSLCALVQFEFLHIFYFRIRDQFGCWQNLASRLVCSCWVCVLSHLELNDIDNLIITRLKITS